MIRRLAAVMILGCLAVSARSQQPAVETAPEPPTVDQTSAGFLMDGLGAIDARKPLDDSGLELWGVLQTGVTWRLTGGQDLLPLRVFEARRPNNLRLHQIRLILDRPYDSSRNFDLGGRMEGMFGGDALLTHSPGLFDQAGWGGGDAWADLLQAYGQLWFKTGQESGWEVTIGKFVTTHGAEVIAAEGNPLYSHSYLFGFAIPFTHTGLKANYIFSSQLSAYFALVQGWEVFNDNNNSPSYMLGGSISSREQVDGNARDQFFFNVITGPEQEADESSYRTVLDTLFTHRWSGRLSQTINADIGTEEGVAGIGQADWYGLAHYLSYVFSDQVTGIWRFEWFRDEGGSRTGVDGSFYANTIGLNLTPWPDHSLLKNLMLRPELRWDHSNRPAFGSDRRDQLTVGLDVVVRF